ARTIAGYARSLGYLSNGQLQGWYVSPNQISQAWPGAPKSAKILIVYLPRLLAAFTQGSSFVDNRRNGLIWISNFSRKIRMTWLARPKFSGMTQ
ncbi:MAG: hypothetical protein J2P21_28595, partial [Chloracidobacterium sp.]|nr:hypothetical protein [Chloracidobacterium sp.]